MNPALSSPRGRFQGLAEIFLFNWHWYAIGFVLLLTASAALFVFHWPIPVRVAVLAAIAITVGWTAGSLGVSHWVYDRSPLCEWHWIEKAASRPPSCWVNVHCGLDESTDSLKTLFPHARAVVLDIFDPEEMTEPSIAQARAARAHGDATRANFRRLPLPSASVDAAFILFAAHELRNPAAREELFGELARILIRGGEILIAEHLRDLPNFCAFGPGAFHFFSRADWLHTFDAAGLKLRREFNITPFVRVFVLRRHYDTGIAS